PLTQTSVGRGGGLILSRSSSQALISVCVVISLTPKPNIHNCFSLLDCGRYQPSPCLSKLIDQAYWDNGQSLIEFDPRPFILLISTLIPRLLPSMRMERNHNVGERWRDARNKP